MFMVDLLNLHNMPHIHSFSAVHATCFCISSLCCRAVRISRAK